MDKKRILHNLRNPWGVGEEEVRAARLEGADLIEKLENTLPLGEQKMPVLVGRVKNNQNVIVQCDGRHVEIPAYLVRDTALAMVMVANEDNENLVRQHD